MKQLMWSAIKYYLVVLAAVSVCMWTLMQTNIPREPVDFAISLPYALGFLIPLGLSLYRRQRLHALACVVFGAGWLVTGFLHYPAGGGEFTGYQMLPGLALYLTQTFGVLCLFFISGFQGRCSWQLLAATGTSLLMAAFGGLILVAATPGDLTLVLLSDTHRGWRVAWNLVFLAQCVPLGIRSHGKPSKTTEGYREPRLSLKERKAA